VPQCLRAVAPNGRGFVYFVKTQLGVRVPSTVMVAPMSQRFVDAIDDFAIGRALGNLPALREIGCAARRRCYTSFR
jgi:hypothetical protein